MTRKSDTRRKPRPSGSEPHEVVPRIVDFGLAPDGPRFWHGGDPVRTRLSDALSLAFPEGERVFIESVRNYLSRVEDPELREQARRFVFQEGQHGKAHELHNRYLADQGIDTARIDRFMRLLRKTMKARVPRVWQLAFTVAGEHITATMAESFLERVDDILGDAEPRMRALLVWHSIEEIEHKAVAYDVWEQVAHGPYWIRIAMYLQVLIWIHVMIGITMADLLRQDGRLPDLPMWARGLWKLYGPNGWFPPLVPRLLAYFDPDFHPWQTKVPSRFDAWRKVWERSGEPIGAAEAIMTNA